MEILTAVNITRDFSTPEGKLSVLRGINLTVNEGEMIAITGESGVGKSTLMHLLGGLDTPTSGEVIVRGEHLKNKSQEALAAFRNKNVGFVFQTHYLLDDFNALENVMLPMLIAGKGNALIREKGEQLLEQVGLIDRRSHLPKQLSGGEQQRVAVARALANEPGIVIADEPSGNLDINTGNKLHELLLNLNKEQKTTFLIATHNRELAADCNRELKLVDGTINR
ncbi:MAG: lipoprotein-releasing system ATP-binding protein LolD [Candidatus Zixiibacteriota bacterium]|nr:MAG: lipoprotein-releasing system ATP-binding protein LolD [candidate division Zixibacteria bacterium]